MRREIREMANAAFVLVSLVIVAIVIVYGLVFALDTAFGPGEQSCVVTLATGDTVTRANCKAYKGSGGVLYCDEVDYSPAAWWSSPARGAGRSTRWWSSMMGGGWSRRVGSCSPAER